MTKGVASRTRKKTGPVSSTARRSLMTTRGASWSSWAGYAPVMLIDDLFKTDEGALADALRPVYLDYLLKHES